MHRNLWSDKRLARRKALTLVELIVAFSVFVFAGLGTYASFLYSQKLMESGTDMAHAVDDLNDMIENINGVAFEGVQSLFPDSIADGGAANDYAAIVGGYSLIDQEIVVSYPVVTSSRLEIEVTVNWTSSGRSFSTSMSTLKIR